MRYVVARQGTRARAVVPVTRGAAQTVSPLQQAIQGWLSGRPELTQEAYKDAIRRAGPSCLTPSLTRDGAAAIGARLAKTYGRATVATTVAALRSLWNELEARGLVSDNPWAKVKTARPKDRTGERILNEWEVRRLLRALATERNRVFVLFLYGTGLRVSEALSVTWRDIRQTDDRRWVASILGKGSRTRTVRIPNVCMDWLVTNRSGHERLWSFKRCRAYDIIHQAAARARLGRNVSPHWLRHTHATQALRAGTPIDQLQLSLGHARLETTARYLHADPSVTSGDFLQKTKIFHGL